MVDINKQVKDVGSILHKRDISGVLTELVIPTRRRHLWDVPDTSADVPLLKTLFLFNFIYWFKLTIYTTFL